VAHPPGPPAASRTETGRGKDRLIDDVLGQPLRQPYRARLAWERTYTRIVVSADFLAGALASGLAYALRFNREIVDVGLGPASPTRLYVLLSAVFPLAWVAAMALNRAYEDRFVGKGAEEFRRVLNAAVRLIALVAIASYATKAEVARAYLLVVFPAAVVLTIGGRAAARVLLVRMRRVGRCRHRVLVVGSGEAAAALVRLAHRDPSIGWNVVGICLDRAPGRHSHSRLQHADFELFDLPIVGTSERLEEAIRVTEATTVAISPQMDGERLRRALWTLEGSDVDVLVSSTVTDVTGPRIHLRPVAGLPLLHIEEPELRGSRRLMKAALDRGVAITALTLLSPALLALALAVRFTSRGPAIFRQTRIGQDGRPFTMFKFRSMFVDAEARRAALADRNERAEGLQFKIRDDPRVTRVGKFLRKWSLDELPQLFNVLVGTMSLIGPRPPLPGEVAQYEGPVHRRLMVKPGLTGLWQVSGRSDLEWEEAVRLDLRYVEDWSLALDLSILWRTVFAVLKREGAY
jgi:exopolysaccharide biosynthesis polyprenyl glycosylphosphotransferase